MDEYLFIDQDFLISNSVINDNVDWKNLRPTIIMVQDIHLQSILGTPLYEDLCAKGLAGTPFTADELTLIKKYIQKTILWYTMMESTPDFKFRYMNKGVMVKSSDNSQAADTKDMLTLMDMWRVKAQKYAELLTDFLTKNMPTFPKYREYTQAGINASRTNSSTGIYLDDYDHEQEEWRKNINGSGCY